MKKVVVNVQIFADSSGDLQKLLHDMLGKKLADFTFQDYFLSMHQALTCQSAEGISREAPKAILFDAQLVFE